MVELSAVSGAMTVTAKTTETNIWQAESPTSWLLIVGFVGAVVVIGIAF